MYDNLLRDAVKYFWKTRQKQSNEQGAQSRIKDTGNRSSVTGGAQLDGFISLFRQVLIDLGLTDTSIHYKETTLPGFFRPTKEWDLVVVHNSKLLATIEFKSQVGPSFGNNFNNRVEEALGNATDFRTAFREGAYKTSGRPWLGYFFLLEKHAKSLSPVRAKEPYFPVFEGFADASYKERYQYFCKKMFREMLYDATCLILSAKEDGLEGNYEEPDSEIGFNSFIQSLSGKILSYIRAR